MNSMTKGSALSSVVMAGLVPAIHAFFSLYAVSGEDVGGRVESGHGEQARSRPVMTSMGH